MSLIIEKMEKENLKEGLPALEIGSTIRVTYKLVEEGKQRLQSFTGLIIAKKGKDIRSTILLRRSTGNIAIERKFFIHSPLITKMEVLRRGKVRRAKLYYLRHKVGKAAKIKEI